MNPKQHGNTFKLVDVIEEELGCDCLNLADNNVDSDYFDLNDYDLIGIASGVAFGRLCNRIESFVESNIFPCNKSVFILYKCGKRNLKYLFRIPSGSMSSCCAKHRIEKF